LEGTVAAIAAPVAPKVGSASRIVGFRSWSGSTATRWWLGPGAGCKMPETKASTRRPTRQASTGRCSRRWLRYRP